jgi:hypothetical protein
MKVWKLEGGDMRRPTPSASLISKLLFLVVAMAPAPFEGLAQDQADLSGTWKVTSTWGSGDRQNQNALIMIVRQNGNEITGSLGPSADEQPLAISNGRIDGDTVTFDLGNERAKLSVKFQRQKEKAQGEFSTSNQQGTTIKGNGTGSSRQTK